MFEPFHALAHCPTGTYARARNVDQLVSVVSILISPDELAYMQYIQYKLSIARQRTV